MFEEHVTPTPKPRKRRLAVSLTVFTTTCILAAASLHSQQDSSPQPQVPIFRGGVNVVRVDVLVTDGKDNPVLDLEPEDFEIKEDGKVQKVETFKLISLDGGLLSTSDGPPRPIRTEEDERDEAARDDVRLFGFLLDDYHVTWANSVSAREQLARFVTTMIGPSDMLALMNPLQPIGAVIMTRNHDAIRRGLAGFTGRKYDHTPINDIEARYVVRLPRQEIERIRNDVTFGAMEALILKLGGLKDGRKALVLVSEGFNVPYNESAPPGPATMQMDVRMRELYELANRFNVSIYALDPRGLAASEFGIDRNVPMAVDRGVLRQSVGYLELLAGSTNGRAIVNRNDFGAAMKQIVIDSSAYYLLGYRSATVPDGKYHEIRVKVNRSGIEVRPRQGYWALKPDVAARLANPLPPPPPNPVAIALAASTVPRTQRIRTLVGLSRADAGKTRVRVVWEPNPTMGNPRGAPIANTRLSIVAAAADGSVVFRGKGATRPGAASSLSFDAPPGPMRLRLSSEEADGSVLDSETRELALPDWTAPLAALATPEVFAIRTLADVERVARDVETPPTTAREFSRSERLLLRVPAYGPGGTNPTATARLLNRSADLIRPLDVSVRDGGPSLIDLPLSNLAPGEYGVEISLGSGPAHVTELVAFRVLP